MKDGKLVRRANLNKLNDSATTSKWIGVTKKAFLPKNTGSVKKVKIMCYSIVILIIPYTINLLNRYEEEFLAPTMAK